MLGLASPRLLTGQVTQVYCKLTCRPLSQPCSHSAKSMVATDMFVEPGVFAGKPYPTVATISLNCIRAEKGTANNYHEMYMGHR